MLTQMFFFHVSHALHWTSVFYFIMLLRSQSSQKAGKYKQKDIMAQRESIGRIRKTRKSGSDFCFLLQPFYFSAGPRFPHRGDSCPLFSSSLSAVFYIRPFLSSPISMWRLKLHFRAEQSNCGQNCKNEPEAENSSFSGR